MNDANEKQSFPTPPLPAGFQYPPGFLAMLELGQFPDIDPWWFLHETPDLLSFWTKTLKGQYPKRVLVPLAKDGGSDDVFCFDGSNTMGNPIVQIIHAYAGPGWEYRGDYDSFEEWLEVAFENAKEFKQSE